MERETQGTKPAAKSPAKPAVKPMAKSSAKPAVKPVAKSPAKPAVKPVAKSPAKPVVKSPTKPAARAKPSASAMMEAILAKERNAARAEVEARAAKPVASAARAAALAKARVKRSTAAKAKAKAKADKVLPCRGSWGREIGVARWGKNIWSACSKPCGGGVKTQTWRTTRQPQNGGTACPSTTTRSQECNTSACPTGVTSTQTQEPAAPTPTVDTTPYEERGKSTLPSSVQTLINTYGALGTYKRCLGNSYGWNAGKKCGKTIGFTAKNASPNLYANYDDPYKTGVIDMAVAQHWVANDNGVNCRDLFTYELDQHKQPVGFEGGNVEVYRVSAANMYKTDMPGAANLGKDLYCPPLYYKVVT